MGGKNDSESVVDTTGKVYGVQSLRVVDASIFPLLPPGHPQSTVCEYPMQPTIQPLSKLNADLTSCTPDMLAEKLADNIMHND